MILHEIKENYTYFQVKWNKCLNHKWILIKVINGYVNMFTEKSQKTIKFN